MKTLLTESEVWQVLETVSDPEVPVLSVCDLGVVRTVNSTPDKLHIEITPTYSGCPAMDTIERDIREALQGATSQPVTITTRLSPAWTTDWMTEAGKAKLEAYGIAPPAHSTDKRILRGEQPTVRCPQCKSTDTTQVSLFGSTACKALYKCNACKEPFDYFKCL